MPEIIGGAAVEAAPAAVVEPGAVESAPQSAQDISESVDPLAAKPAAVDEDPEIEFEDGLKLRKSEATNALKRRKELDRAAFEKFQEAATLRKQMESLREADPEEFFKLRGVDPLEFAVQRLQREMAMREATPEQRRALQLEQQLEGERAQRMEYERQVQQQHFEQERQQYVQKLDKELPAAMQKHGLSADPLTFGLVAQQIRHQVLNELPEDYEAAAEMVADTYRQSFQRHTATLKYEDAVKQYPELIKLIREGDLARAKAPLSVRNTDSKPSSAPKAPQAQPKKDWMMDDWAASGIRVVR